VPTRTTGSEPLRLGGGLRVGWRGQMDDLSPPNTIRRVARRKAAVVAAVRSGRITMEEPLSRYHLSEDEFLSWQRTFEAHGLAGLHATRGQQYRGSRPPSGPRSLR
jgi:hypothetical protein